MDWFAPTPDLATHYRPLLDLLERRYLKAEELAERWRWSEQNLANMRRKPNCGPAFIRFGRSVRYPMAEALRWELRGQSDHVTPDRVALAVAALPFSTEQRELIAAHLQATLFRGEV